MGGAYYNEWEPYAAQWLRNLIARGLIPAGDVDERDIQDVRPDDLRGYRQCHFFAGIGGWASALRIAKWEDDRPVWTGSCPCQPFSQAGKRAGNTDERHLWPSFFHLIRERKPQVLFGEQVDSPDGVAWLDLVSSDLEGEEYACGPITLPACGFGAPHIRHRIWIVAEPIAKRRERLGLLLQSRRQVIPGLEIARSREACELADIASDGRRQGRQDGSGRGEGTSASQKRMGLEFDGDPCELGNAGFNGIGEYVGKLPCDETEYEIRGANGDHASLTASSVGFLDDTSRAGRPGRPRKRRNDVKGLASFERTGGPVNGFWGDSEWLPCRDGKYRPAKPGIFPLAHGVPARVGKLRAAGNAIVPQVAAEVIAAYMEWSR